MNSLWKVLEVPNEPRKAGRSPGHRYKVDSYIRNKSTIHEPRPRLMHVLYLRAPEDRGHWEGKNEDVDGSHSTSTRGALSLSASKTSTAPSSRTPEVQLVAAFNRDA